MLPPSSPMSFWPKASFFTLSVIISSSLGACWPVAAAPSHQENHSPQSLVSAPRSAQALIQQGIVNYQAEQFDEAIHQWKQVLPTLAPVEAPFQRAFVLSNLSLAQQHLGQWNEAERNLDASLQLLRQHSAQTSEEQEILAKTFNAEGRLNWAQGNSEAAYQSWQIAAEHYQLAGSVQGELGSLMNQAKALQALGLTTQAKVLLQQVAQVLETAPTSSLKYHGLRNLGEILRQVGQFQESRRVLLDALQLNPDNSDKAGLLVELGNTEFSFWNRALSLEQTEKAETHFEAAQAHYLEAARISQPQSPLHQQAQLNQLSLLVNAGKSEAINHLWPQLYRSVQSQPPSRTNLVAKVNLAQSLIRFRSNAASHLKATKAQTPKASSLPRWTTLIQLLHDARQQAHQLGDQRLEAYALGELGNIYEQNQQWEDAEKLTQSAITLSEQVAALDLRYRWEWQMGRLSQHQNRPEDAIVYYEAAVETLEKVRRDVLIVNPDAQFSLRDNVEPIYRELVGLLLSSDASTPPSQENLKRALNEIDALQLAEIQDFLRCDLTTAVEIISSEEAVVDPTAAILYPILLDNQIAIILDLPGEKALKYYTTSVEQDQVDTTLEALRTEIERRYPRPKGYQLSKQVYDWLITPLQGELAAQEIETLVFILDGKLRNISPAALHDGQQYLIENYAVALSPGLKLLQPQPLKDQDLNALNFGLSEMQPEEVEAHQNFAPLGNVEAEIQTIGSYVPSQSFLNQQFTQNNLVVQLEKYPFPILHLATHGQFSSDLEETFILAWDKRLDIHELGQLLQTRSQQHRQALELLVLSACETASGDNRATLGLAGLAVRSGARSTLASLWPVNDESTALLMGEFYQVLGTSDSSITKAKALQQAQLKLLQQGKGPGFWSPYILVGNWL